MKNNEYRLRKQLYELKDLEQRGVKSVSWKLSEEQLYFFGRYYEVVPFLYTIRTRPFSRIYNIKSPLLKDIHYANKRGKKEMTRELTEADRKLLDDYGVKYKVCKYHIVLNKR